MTRELTGAPHGTKLHCKGWVQEAAYRMLLHNLDPDVAEDNTRLVVYGGTGRANLTLGRVGRPNVEMVGPADSS